MKWIPTLLCQHNKVKLSRSHKDVCAEHHGKEAWIDHHGCYNFVVCADCGTVLKAHRTTEIFPAYKP